MKKLERKDKSLEGKILNSIYKYETKRTLFSLVKYFLLFVLIISLILLLLSQILSTLSSQGTLELLEILGEDWEILSQYWMEVLETFIFEAPLWLIFALFVSVLGLVGIFIFFIRNFRKINNKLSRILKWFK